jgi:hypothetical protein
MKFYFARGKRTVSTRQLWRLEGIQMCPSEKVTLFTDTSILWPTPRWYEYLSVYSSFGINDPFGS